MYYNPSSLPYNPTAPLRNTIPYVPLEIGEDSVRLSHLVPAEYVNKDLRAFISETNSRRTPAAAAETRFLKESLGLETIHRNLMVLGSVLEDDALSLSSDGEQGDVLLEGGSASHYPPRTLKEIYSLPAQESRRSEGGRGGGRGGGGGGQRGAAGRALAAGAGCAVDGARHRPA